MMMMSRNKATADKRYASFTTRMCAHALRRVNIEPVQKTRRRRRRRRERDSRCTLLLDVSLCKSALAVISSFARFPSVDGDRLRMRQSFFTCLSTQTKRLTVYHSFIFYTSVAVRSFNHRCRLLICSKAHSARERGRERGRKNMLASCEFVLFELHSLMMAMMQPKETFRLA